MGSENRCLSFFHRNNLHGHLGIIGIEIKIRIKYMTLILLPPQSPRPLPKKKKKKKLFYEFHYVLDWSLSTWHYHHLSPLRSETVFPELLPCIFLSVNLSKWRTFMSLGSSANQSLLLSETRVVQMQQASRFFISCHFGIIVAHRVPQHHYGTSISCIPLSQSFLFCLSTKGWCQVPFSPIRQP